MNKPELKLAELRALFGERISQNEPLAPYTWFKIGGPATFFFIAKNNDELIAAVNAAKKSKIPFWVFSGGSNLLINSKGLDKFVIKIESSDIVVKDDCIVADAGAVLMDVVTTANQNGLKGIQWASGIPGNIGGAVRGNAGAYGGEMKDIVTDVEVLRGSKQMVLKREGIDFGYRDSQFKKSSDIILAVKIKLQKGHDPLELKKKSEEIVADRATKHPHDPSAGSFFKNIPIDRSNEDLFKKLDAPQKFFEYRKVASGWLIDKLDLRGTKIGGAKISDQHANIIINTGNATSDDVLELVSLIKTKVRDAYGIQLHEEVQYID